jgi:hypothetical protein
MTNPKDSQTVERLFPFVLRSRALIIGRDMLIRSKSKLQFILVTSDLTDNSRAEILYKFARYPIVQRYTSEELRTFFGIRGTKVVGFKKSDLARAVYAGLKEYRINRPSNYSVKSVR